MNEYLSRRSGASARNLSLASFAATLAFLLALPHTSFAGRENYSSTEICQRATAEFNRDGGTGLELDGDRKVVLRNLTADNNLAPNAMYLVCDGMTVNMVHNTADILQDKADDGTSLNTTSTTPKELNFTLDQGDVIALNAAKDLSANPLWCTLVVPESGTADPQCLPGGGAQTWTFNNAYYMDRREPDISSAADKLKVWPVVPLCPTCGVTKSYTGFGLLKWRLSDGPGGGQDPYTTAYDIDSSCDDPNFDMRYPGGNCRDGTHNKAPTVHSFPIYRAPGLGGYPTYPPSASILTYHQALDLPSIINQQEVFASNQIGYQRDFQGSEEDAIGGLDTQVTIQNRTDSDALAYCYVFTVTDTASNTVELNASELDLNDVRCFYPDTKRPEFVQIDYYKDAAFTNPLPKDGAGRYVATYNPCFFRDDCNPIPERIIYMKVETDEPLFGTPKIGNTLVPDDGLDNDGDGFIDEEGGSFNHIDDDGDGQIDEDVSLTGCVDTTGSMYKSDRIDNDCDGYVDEEPDMNNSDSDDDDNDGLTNEDKANEFCSTNKLYNSAMTEALREANDNLSDPICMYRPTIGIADTIANVDVDPASPDPLNWLCTSLGGGITIPLGEAQCESLDAGHSIYTYAWNVTNGIFHEDDEATILLTGTDSSGNLTLEDTPDHGGTIKIDNTPPVIKASFPSVTSYFDHDNNSSTVKVQVLKANNPGESYRIRFTTDEAVMATPTVRVFFPTDVTPSWLGQPSASNTLDIELEKFSCDDDEPCRYFDAYIQVTNSTNNGLAQITAAVEDQLKNRQWHELDAQAAVDTWDDDRKSDDVGIDGIAGTGDPGEGDGYPTIGELDVQPGEEEGDGRYFAIDTIPPEVPFLTLPVTPCEGTYARSGGLTCDTSNPTTKKPTLSWSPLSDGLDNDSDGSIDEEFLDGIDNDGDLVVDEDAAAADQFGTIVGAPGWQIGFWTLQLSTDPTFATDVSAFSVTENKTDASPPTYQFSGSGLPERTIGEPYYWRVFAQDLAKNMSLTSSPEATIGVASGVFSFAVDVTKPDLEIEFFSDINRTTPLLIDPVTQLPVVGDTFICGIKVYMTIAATEKLKSVPSLRLMQNNKQILASSKLNIRQDPDGKEKIEFLGEFDVDATGAGKDFDNGIVTILATASDLAGNLLNDVEPASGSKILIDTSEMRIEEITTSPSRASMDNDGDGTASELCNGVADPGDGVIIRVTANKPPREPVTLKVMQEGFNDPPLTENDFDDLLDNDCDGQIDEEPDGANGLDDDGDGLTDEDVTAGSEGGGLPGSGCLIQMEQAESGVVYEGCYDVVPGYDGDATIVAQFQDRACNFDLETHTFTVDTSPPLSPTLKSPINGANTKNTAPNFEFRVQRESDLKDYVLQVATNKSFASGTIAYTATILDSGVTKYIHTLPSGFDFDDGTYYWRVTSRDTAKNQSDPSATFELVIDTVPPDPPLFVISGASVNAAGMTVVSMVNAVISGETDPGAEVTIWVNGEPVGAVTADDNGDFFVGIDEDNDGDADEEDNPPTCSQGEDGLDNDDDDDIDEDLCGVKLIEGENIIEGQAKDKAGNVGQAGCDPDTSFYDSGEKTCIVRRDTGYPTFNATYYADEDFKTPLPVHPYQNKFVAKVLETGPIYILITSSEDLMDENGDPLPPTYTINQPGTADVSQTETTSLNGSLRLFYTSYQVVKSDGSAHIDGAAAIFVKGIDPEGNETPDLLGLNNGGVFLIDTTPPSFQVEYYLNDELAETPFRNDDLKALAKAGDLYLKIKTSEYLPAPPYVNINQAGSIDIEGAPTENVVLHGGVTDDFSYVYKYKVKAHDGSNYIDGEAAVSISGVDVAGNSAQSVSPTLGASFVVDTTPPGKPTLTLSYDSKACLDRRESEIDAYTLFTQMTGSGTLADEPYGSIQVYVRKKGAYPPSPGDDIDDDGDGRVDEEPNGADGVDNDMDGFIDEDTINETCASGTLWDSVAKECFSTSNRIKTPNGQAAVLSDGSFTVNISGIKSGKNLVFVRGVDKVGNIGEYSPSASASDQYIVLNCQQIVSSDNIYGTFSDGWQMVGVPLQSAYHTPHQAFGLYDSTICNIDKDENGFDKYVCGVNGATNLQDPEPGAAYWIYFENETNQVRIASGVYSTTREVALNEGWNMISLPYYSEQAVAWDGGEKGVKVRSSKSVSGSVAVTAGTEYDIDSDEAAVLINPQIFKWDSAEGEPDAYVELEPGSTNVKSWEGFLIEALRSGVTLVFPPAEER